jgi:hypothetical protein
MAKATTDTKAHSRTKKAKVSKVGTAENRDFRRRSVLWPGKILIGSHEISCQIWNLSLGGARVRIDLPIQEGTAVKLFVKGRGELPATVIWSREGSLGLEFRTEAGVVRRMFKDRLHVLGLDEADES